MARMEAERLVSELNAKCDGKHWFATLIDGVWRVKQYRPNPYKLLGIGS